LNDQFVVPARDQDGNPLISEGKSNIVLDWWALCKSLLLGVLAAFVVPLFLVLAAPGQQGGIIRQLMTETCATTAQALDSVAEQLEQIAKSPVNNPAGVKTSVGKIAATTEDVENARKLFGEASKDCIKVNEWWNNLLILIGFCIVAALIAQRFLQNIAEKLLKEAKEDANDARKIAVVARVESRQALESARNLGPDQELDETAVNVLKALAKIPEPVSSAEQIAKLAKLKPDEVAGVLEDMKEGGLIVEDDEKKDRWKLRGWGMIRARKEIGLSDNDVRVLEGIKDIPDRRPTAQALAQSLNIPQTEMDEAIQRLERFGLIARSGSVKGWLAGTVLG